MLMDWQNRYMHECRREEPTLTHFEDVKSPTKWPSKTLGLLHEYSDKFSG